MALGDVIARLAVSLNLETAAFDKGARHATGTVGKMQRNMARAATAIGGAFAGIQIGAAVNAFRDMAKAALDSAGGMGEAAAQIGVTTKSLQEYRFAATQVGLSTKEMELGLAQLTRRLGDAAQGVKEPVKALEAIGLSAEKLKGLETGDVIPLIAEGLAKIPDAGERAAVAVDLFGKSGQKLLPLLEGGAAGVEAFRKQAQELGIVLSEGEIAKADEVADKLAALNYQIEAQQNKKLLENAEAVIAYEEAIGSFKLAAISAVGDLEKANQRYNAWALQFNAELRSGINGVVEFAALIPAKLREATNAAVQAVTNMVNGIRAWIGGRLNAVWDGVTSRIDAVAAKFKWLDNVVVRNSYIPDMVVSIGEHMARLDGLMVGPARKAIDKVADDFRRLRSLMDELFPATAALNLYRDDRSFIEGRTDLSQAEKDEFITRLNRRLAGVRGDVDVTAQQGPLDVTKGLDDVLDALDTFKKRAGSTTVSVAKSFKDMADETVRSLTGLANAIKGGGFLGILEAVINLGLQLGSIGAFGSKVAARINAPKIPGRALGGPISAGMPYMVGERGPELVVPRHNGTVIPNNKLGAQRIQVEVVANNDGFGAIVRNHAGQVVAEAAGPIMQGGAQVAQSQWAYRQSRRVA